MDYKSRETLKYILHWTGVLILLVYAAIRYLFPLIGVDTTWFFPEIRYTLFLALGFMFAGHYLHRCNTCNKQLYGWVYTNNCKQCEDDK